MHASFYGPRMQLAEDAQRFDVSPAWFSWVGAAPAIALLERIGLPAVHGHMSRSRTVSCAASGAHPATARS